MLVITLRPHDYVAIGKDIKIYNNNADPMRIGIDAPREVDIVRADAKNKSRKK